MNMLTVEAVFLTVITDQDMAGLLPKYLPETEKKFRTGQMTKARVNDQLGYAGIDEKEAWWKEPLEALGGRAPESFYDDDPLAVFLCAKYGITSQASERDSESADGSDEADPRVRPAVSAEELDEVRDTNQSDEGSDGDVPGWWS